jgi:site-specific recombinase XerD
MTGPMKYLSTKQVQAFFAKIDDKRDRALFNVIYKYGLRASEATLLDPLTSIWSMAGSTSPG